MSMSFSEYSAAMVGCYSAITPAERDELHAWEVEHVDGSGTYGTSDWPGWEKYIGKYQSPIPQGRNTFGYVYVVQSDTGQCKIGSSRSVARRIQQLQCANPGRLVLLHQFPSANAHLDEYSLHQKFGHRRVMNEWFALTDLDIASVRCTKGANQGLGNVEATVANLVSG